MIYSQTDGRWSGLHLGYSGLTCGHAGCYCTSIANILTRAGYNVTPADVINQLNKIGGFTSGGLAIHAKVTQAFPYFRYDGGNGYSLIGGMVSNRFYHFIAGMPDGSVADPLYGQPHAPAGFAEGSRQGITVVAPTTPTPPPSNPALFTVQVTTPLGLKVHSAASKNTPETRSPLPHGYKTDVLEVVSGENIDGNTTWYKIDTNQYITSAYTRKV